jgi:hypothetical protein
MKTISLVVAGALVLALPIGACGKSKGGAASRSYTLFATKAHDTPGIPLTIDVPTDWTEEKDVFGAPSFTPADYTNPFTPDLRLTSCPDEATTEDACAIAAIAHAVAQGGATTKVERGAASSRWVTFEREVKGHQQLLLHRYVPRVASHQVVVCGAMLVDDGRAIAEPMRKMCDTLALQ